MAVTRFFEGIDYGSGVILRIRVSTFIEGSGLCPARRVCAEGFKVVNRI